MRPRILDLFCGAGGAAVGYVRAGFEVVGVDIKPQPNYPFDFVQMDALEFLRRRHPWTRWCDERCAPRFVAIHASPPCQAFTAYRRKGNGVGDGYPDLIGPTRELLQATGLPYVIENVPGSPLENPIQLCGSSLGLDVRRHRLFECSFPVMALPCAHGQQTGRFPAATNRAENSRRTVEVGVWRIPLKVQQRAMGIDWMDVAELSQAIPPAYTAYIGTALMGAIEKGRASSDSPAQTTP